MLNTITVLSCGIKFDTSTMGTVSNFTENAIGLKMVIDCDTSIYTSSMDTVSNFKENVLGL